MISMPDVRQILDYEMDELNSTCSSEGRTVAELMSDVIASSLEDGYSDSDLARVVVSSLEELASYASAAARSIRSKLAIQ